MIVNLFYYLDVSTGKINLVTFTLNGKLFENLKETNLVSALINNLKSARYGINILIAYSKFTSTPSTSGISSLAGNTSPTSFVLVDFTGKIVTADVLGQELNLPINDEFKVLTSGSNLGTILWTYIDSNKNLKLYTIPIVGSSQRESLDNKSTYETPLSTKAENLNQINEVIELLKCESGLGSKGNLLTLKLIIGLTFFITITLF